MEKQLKIIIEKLEKVQSLMPKVKVAGKSGSNMPKGPKIGEPTKIKGTTPVSQKNPNRVEGHQAQAELAGKGMIKQDESTATQDNNLQMSFEKNGQWKIK